MADEAHGLMGADVASDEEGQLEVSLRPRRLATYIGQAKLKAELQVYIEAAKGREEAWITSSCMARRGWGRRPWRW